MYIKELQQILSEQSEKLVLLDVRETAETERESFFPVVPKNYFHLSLGAVMILSRAELTARLTEVVSALGWKLEDVRIIILCHSGRRAERASKYLGSLGFRAENLSGGYLAWREK